MKIALCGSMVFYDHMETLGEQLRNLGHIVEVPQLRINSEEAPNGKKSIRNLIEESGGTGSFAPDHPIWVEKAEAIDDHFIKIAYSDAILVANYPKHSTDGYIGGNTLMELAVARYLNKSIYLLFPVSDKLQYKEEVLGVLPIILHNNLERLPQ